MSNPYQRPSDKDNSGELIVAFREHVVKTATRFAQLPPGFFLEVKVAHLLDKLRRKFEDFRRLRVLDVGCGVGMTDQFLKVYLPLLAGVDISGKSLDVARVRNPEIAYHHSADDKLPFVNGSFDSCS
jgi:SAM-dependent methyltransferase